MKKTNPSMPMSSNSPSNSRKGTDITMAIHSVMNGCPMCEYRLIDMEGVIGCPRFQL